ncbi:MAG: hypothetical protein N2689_01560 [Verrucomicrobiae bacterium]|nr:hypothetical protein [Verrucomicrobiae bacterium]
MPAPTLVNQPPKPPPPPPSWMTPDTMVLRLLPPTVRFLLPRKKLPEPSMEADADTAGGQEAASLTPRR